MTAMDHTTTYGPDGPITLPDDGRRYALTGPRGISPFLDNLAPDADHHTISVYGSVDLARRVAEAHEMGVCVSFRQLDESSPTGADASQAPAASQYTDDADEV